MASSSYDLYTVLGLLSIVIAPVNKILTTQIQQQTFSNPSHLFPPLMLGAVQSNGRAVMVSYDCKQPSSFVIRFMSLIVGGRQILELNLKPIEATVSHSLWCGLPFLVFIRRDTWFQAQSPSSFYLGSRILGGMLPWTPLPCTVENRSISQQSWVLVWHF